MSDSVALAPAPQQNQAVAISSLAPDIPIQPPTRGWLWQLVTIATGLLAGVGLLMVGHKYWSYKVFPPPIYKINYQLSRTPNPAFTQTLVAAIFQAKQEVLISAHRLSSQMLLSALKERADHGISVKLLLDEKSNGSALSGPLAWLQRNNFKDVYFDSLENENQFLVIDGNFVFLGTTAFTADAPISTASSGVFIADTTFATELRKYFFERLGNGHLLR